MSRIHTFSLIGFVFLGTSILLSGCTRDGFSRAGYEAVKNRHCNEQIHAPDCQGNYPSYEEYQREQSKIPE